MRKWGFVALISCLGAVGCANGDAAPASPTPNGTPENPSADDTFESPPNQIDIDGMEVPEPRGERATVLGPARAPAIDEDAYEDKP